ncbi:DEAD/DEAH box helicase [Salinilacustrithrix flava]|uniref:DEAD/DEAH box helicase n=1 Tax=Salinilacustrithrix flava TaxID=2957203 RepID=UPI003D7C1BB4
MLSSDSIAQFFANAPVNIAGNPYLRTPQIDGHAAAVRHFATSDERAIEQIPVGCGKSGLIALLPFGVARGRVLVIAPNLAIKDQLADDLDVTSASCFYRRTNVLADLSSGPFRAELDADANIHDCHNAHIVVTNIHQLAERAEGWLSQFPADFFDLIVVDEGHHNAAPTWQNVFDAFPLARVISLTATPFRADGAEVAGESIYKYTFREAIRKGYIKDIRAENVAPTELVFTYQGDERRHTLDEVLELREEDWFSKGVALAEECNKSIVDASVLWLRDLRTTGTHHQLIAVACSIDHARQIRGLYAELGLSAKVIHSRMETADKDNVIRDLKAGILDVVVQVQMLGEGFDHPPLSVAAVFRPFRSLSPYIQFVGRVMRVNVQNAPQHPDNRGVVVSHIGLNIERHWADFKRLDADDQELIAGWVGGNSAENAGGDGDGASPWRDGGHMDVTREILSDRFISDLFLDDADDDAVIDNAMETSREQGLDLELLGITRDDLRRRFAEARARSGPVGPERLPVQPQAHRKVQRQRLDEQVKSQASTVCSTLGEAASGRRIALLGGTGATNNLGAVIVLLNRRVSTHPAVDGTDRAELSLDQIEAARAALPELAQEVAAELAGRL